MSSHHRPPHQSLPFRRRFIDQADRTLAAAKELTAQAGLARTSSPRWLDAGCLLEEAATLYRKAGLGLIARHAYSDAARCHREAGAVVDAERCEESAKAVPVYWGGLTHE